MSSYNQVSGEGAFKLKYFIPFMGIVLFIILHFVAQLTYPGGSIIDSNSFGYSNMWNFLCDLMHLEALNGLKNPSRMLAIVAHWILSFSMAFFFYNLPLLFEKKNINAQLIRNLGALSMCTLLFYATEWHDAAVPYTGALGLIIAFPLWIEFKKLKSRALKMFAAACLFFSFLLFVMYQFQLVYDFAPLVQRIAFVLDAILVFWTGWLISTNQRQKAKQSYNQAAN